MSHSINRRELLRGAAAGALLGGAAQLAHGQGAGPLPKRALGKTGVQAPILGYGSAPTGTRRTLEDAVALYHYAIDQGITYLDTAPELGGYGQAQVQLGHVLRERRQEVFLVTKCWEPRGEDALRLLEANLKELQTDRADLVYAHSIGSDKMDPEVVMGRGGVMEMLQKAKAEGLARFIGISGHNRPARFVELLRRYEIDVMMNAVSLGAKHVYDFEGTVWPLAAEKQIGLVAMKVFGGSQGQGLSNSRMPTERLALAARYAWSLPNVTTAVLGMATKAEIDRNLAWAKAFQPLSATEAAEAERIGRELGRQWGPVYGVVT